MAGLDDSGSHGVWRRGDGDSDDDVVAQGIEETHDSTTISGLVRLDASSGLDASDPNAPNAVAISE